MCSSQRSQAFELATTTERLQLSGGYTVHAFNSPPAILVARVNVRSLGKPVSFCFPWSPDVSLDFVSGNIRTLGKTKLTVPLGN